MLRWSSNKAEVADRAFTICRVINGQIEIMPDPKTGHFVVVYIDAKDAPEPPKEEPKVDLSPLDYEIEAREPEKKERR